MISYSHNFEDVILARALGSITHGFYIDVGAATPIHSSNTYAFYEHGWWGLVVDPLFRLWPQYRAEWERTRPRDLLAAVAAGKETGHTEFWVAGHMQCSTASPETLAYFRKLGSQIPDHGTIVNVYSLTTILDATATSVAAAGGPIHLLTVDVEGMELDVVQGLDLSRYRPWIILAEVTKPGTIELAPHAAPLYQYLCDKDYVRVLFDGTNEFYLDIEHIELAKHFKLPLNCHDNFKLYREVLLENRIKELEEITNPAFGR
jgi:FkbM family methyltransferase